MDILLVGHNMMTAHNMARDLIEAKGETIVEEQKRATLPYIETEEGNTYIFLAHFEVAKRQREMRGMTFDEVYFMSDFMVMVAEELKKELALVTKGAEFKLMHPHALGFTWK